MNNIIELKINGKIYVLQNPKNKSEELLIDNLLYFNSDSKDFIEIIEGISLSFQAFEGHLEISEEQ